MLVNVANRQSQAPRVLHMFCANLTWLNSCINPVLYAVMNRQFRQAYHLLLTRAASPFTCLWTRWQALRF
ncbi:G-protein coupled receptor 84-like [Lates japonicus]